MAADVSPADKIITIAGRRFITPAALAQLLGVSLRTLARWHQQEVGPPRAQIGRTVLHDVEKLSDWLAGHKSKPVRRSKQTKGPAGAQPAA